MWFMDNIATLEIASAEGADIGKYICQIKNDAGMRECSAFLQVLGGYSLFHKYSILRLSQLSLPPLVCCLYPMLTGLQVDFLVTHCPLPSSFRTSSNLREDWADYSDGWQPFYLGVQSRRNTWTYHQVVQRWQRTKEWSQIPNYLFQQYLHSESLFCREGRQGLIYFWGAQWGGGQQLHFFSWCFRSALYLVFKSSVVVFFLLCFCFPLHWKQTNKSFFLFFFCLVLLRSPCSSFILKKIKGNKWGAGIFSAAGMQSVRHIPHISGLVSGWEWDC